MRTGGEMRIRRKAGLATSILLLSVAMLFCCQGASAQADPAGLPIIGTWRVNLDKSSPGVRKFRAPTWTCTYVVENGGIQHTMYDVYPPKYTGLPTGVAPHDHTYFFKLDGKQLYKDPEGPNGEGQTVAMWLVTRNVIFRQRQTKGVDDERVLYVVSPDGNTLTWYVWSANNPNPQGATNEIVWDRVK
jgi:hypothetical protein